MELKRSTHYVILVLPIMMVSFALQESSCNPETVGGAGEQGLLQLTKDKCIDAPNGNCRDVVSFPLTYRAYIASKPLLFSSGL